MLWLIPTVVVAGTFLALTRRARASIPGDPGDTEFGGTGDRDVPEIAPGHTDVRALAASAGAPPAWQDFYALVARGESNSTAAVGLGIAEGFPPWAKRNQSTGEAKAAKKLFLAHPKRVDGCGWGAAVYCFGSGGLFAMLPMTALSPFRDDPILRCVHPWAIFDPTVTIIGAVSFGYWLQNLDGANTVVAMRRGWGNPSKRNEAPSEKTRAKWAGHCQDVGLAPSFLDKTLPYWKPASGPALFASLGAPAEWLPNPELYTRAA